MDCLKYSDKRKGRQEAEIQKKSTGFDSYAPIFISEKWLISYPAASNSSRKRVSFSENMRRSETRYFRLVMRSTPIPKA